MRPLHLFLAFVVAIPSVTARAQHVPADSVKADSSRVIEMAPVVVTATRSEKALEDVAVPTTVVLAETMRMQGAARLGDVLVTVPGLTLFDDHGTGLQVQGFSPDYTLILLDGEPVIGRTAGTLDLNRLTVQGLDRVEIVRGPSSSLYGSEALAGVVNLITAPAAEGFRSALGARFGSFGTTDLTTEVEAGRERAGARLFFNRYASAGYDLTPASFGATSPAFTDWTADWRSRLALSDRVLLRLGARATVEDQESTFALRADGVEVRYDDDGRRVDWTLHPEARIRLSDRFRLTTTVYGARYRTETRYRRQSDGVLTYGDDFGQYYLKAEAQLDALWNRRHLTSLGGGAVRERLGGDRYGPDADGERPTANQTYAFAQHEWLPLRLFEVSASARFDAHSDYAAQLTPKIALLVRPADNLRFRVSVGSGFKAPAFRQFYLAFTNAAAGYSVFGATRLQEGVARLQAEGAIDRLFIDPATLEEIRAESSVAINIGGSIEPFSRLALSANAFRNNVRDLIETQPIAQKTNGQFVFGYFNLARIYTRGVEADATIRAIAEQRNRLDISFGYQFLQARDREVVEALETGTVFGRDPSGREYRLGPGDYGGMFGRSPHTATLRAAYAHTPFGLTASVRGRWRSRYGYRDLDGNALANRDDEFVPAYAVFDATVTRTVPALGPADAEIQFGVDNVLDITRPALVPSLPGRRLYVALRIML